MLTRLNFTRLNQAIAITLVLYLIAGIDQLTTARPTSRVTTPRPPIGLKVLPQPTVKMNTPIELKALPQPAVQPGNPKF